MIQALEHVALSVADMDRSLAFYRDFLGLEVIMDIHAADELIGRIIGIPGAKCRIVHLKLGAAVLELFCYSNPPGKNAAGKMLQCDHGLTHIGFKVTDFHAELAKLMKSKIELLGAPVEFRPGVWVVYFRGPDGEVCEFRQADNQGSTGMNCRIP